MAAIVLILQNTQTDFVISRCCCVQDGKKM